MFLLPNMKPEHRRGERALWREAAESMGLTTVSVGGTWEAQGDVAFFRDRVILFFGGRTTEEGARDAKTHLGALGDPLLVAIQEPAFHGNMALLPLPAVDRMLVCPDVLAGDSLARLESAFGAERLLRVTVEEIRAYATNGLPMGRDVLAPHLTPLRIQELLRSLGFHVAILSMVELCEKAGGASRCLVSHAPVDAGQVLVPAPLDYRARREELLLRLPDVVRDAVEESRPGIADKATADYYRSLRGDEKAEDESLSRGLSDAARRVNFDD
jgi:N-dimethylarginine dimethylaminohydrolase